MKKIWILFLISLSLASLYGCQNKQLKNKTLNPNNERKIIEDSEADNIENYLFYQEDTYNSYGDISGNSDISDYIPEELTYNDFSDDYDYFWKILDKAYPFFGVLERQGYDVNTLRETSRDLITEETTLNEFYKIMNDTISSLDGVGHLSLINTSSIINMLDSYPSESENGDYGEHIYSTGKILRNPRSIRTYQYLGADIILDHSENEETNLQIEVATQNRNCTTRIIEEDNIAYIKIDSFEHSNINVDSEILLPFYKMITKYPNLIIDIRGNTGGSDGYWKYNIMEQLLVSPIDTETIGLYSENTVISDYLKQARRYDEHKTVDQLTGLSNLNPDDKVLLDKYTVEYVCIEPRSNTVGFEGNIWVLVDETVYSSAETFVMMCSDTGFATLVGSQTGGDGGSIDPQFFCLPNTGLIWRNSSVYTINKDGSNNEEFGTSPSIIIEVGQDALNICMEAIYKND